MGDGGDFIVAWSSDTGASACSPGDWTRSETRWARTSQVSANEAYPGPRVAKLDSWTGGFVVAWPGHPPGTPGSAPNGPPPQQTSIYAQRFETRRSPPPSSTSCSSLRAADSTFRVDMDVPFSTLAYPDVAIAPDGPSSSHGPHRQDSSADEIFARRFDFRRAAPCRSTPARAAGPPT